ncbi:hypothetical protein D0T49_08810 [Paludibacter sp. 221]|nr:hypothetical protein [Paludibacter sp. 221]
MLSLAVGSVYFSFKDSIVNEQDVMLAYSIDFATSSYKTPISKDIKEGKPKDDNLLIPQVELSKNISDELFNKENLHEIRFTPAPIALQASSVTKHTKEDAVSINSSGGGGSGSSSLSLLAGLAKKQNVNINNNAMLASASRKNFSPEEQSEEAETVDRLTHPGFEPLSDSLPLSANVFILLVFAGIYIVLKKLYLK